MVGPVGFELAARVALEVAPVRLGRFRPRLASAQPPDLGGEQLAQAVEYPSEFGADGGQQAVAAPDLTVGLAPLADASGPFDDPWANDEADGYQPPSYAPVNPERRNPQAPSDSLI